MDNKPYDQTHQDAINHAKTKLDEGKAHIADAASELMNEGKKYANELYETGVSKAKDMYEQGVSQATDVKENMKEYTETLAVKVKENPIASVLVAAGVGYILSALLKK